MSKTCYNRFIMKLRIKKLHKDAVVPSYAHKGDAGLDLFSPEKVVVKKGERSQVSTGLAFQIPDGYVGLVWDKSGLSHKYGIKTLGGVLDAGYRGELLVGVVNLGEEDYIFEKGHKVAQLLIQKIEFTQIETVDELENNTTRGVGGIGSTGK